MGDSFTRDDLYVAVRDVLHGIPALARGDLFVADSIRDGLANSLGLSKQEQQTRSWNTDVSWALIELRDFGYLESPPEHEERVWRRWHGFKASGGPRVWRLTEQGREWVQVRGNVVQPAVSPHRAKPVPQPRVYDAPKAEPVRPAAKAPDNSSDLAAHTALDQLLAQIRAFLTGRTAERPSDEVLCDWMQFSYMAGLYRETGALF